MSRSAPQCERFLSRAHRRYVVLRALERTGLGLLFGSAAALPLLGVALWRGGNALQVAGVALAGGAIGGLLWGLLTRPSRMATALEADRQLGWADLLGSAMMIRAWASDDPFAAAVIEAADERCRRTSPSALVLHRLGARSWGGIGLASALVIVLGLLPTFAAPTQADEQNDRVHNPLALLGSNEPPAALTARSVPRRTAPQQNSDDPNASRMEGAEAEPSGPNATNTTGPDGPHSPNESADASSHGTGASQSKLAQPGALNQATAGSDARSSRASLRDSAGVGRVSDGSGSGVGSGQTAGTTSKEPRPAPPWRSAEWGADAQRAIDAVNSGRIPDAYRDVIRAYFDRP